MGNIVAQNSQKSPLNAAENQLDDNDNNNNNNWNTSIE